MATMKLDDAGLAKISGLCDEVTDTVLDLVYQDASRYCPVRTGNLKRKIRKFRAGKSGYVIVDADYWADVEYGTRPHVIRSRGPYPLRSEDGTVFGPKVDHPGTAAQPFMRPAIYRTRVVR